MKFLDESEIRDSRAFSVDSMQGVKRLLDAPTVVLDLRDIAMQEHFVRITF